MKIGYLLTWADTKVYICNFHWLSALYYFLRVEIKIVAIFRMVLFLDADWTVGYKIPDYIV